jgi:hypothetical protein
MYSVFCGSSGRQSAAEDDDRTSAEVVGRRADSAAAGCTGGVAAIACAAINETANRRDMEMVFTFTPPL